MSVAAIEPHVPGPGLPSPAPKKVATVQAQKVFRPDWNAQVGPAGHPPCAAWSWAALILACIAKSCLAVTFVALEVFQQIGIEDGRTDLVNAHGPFAEVDAAAAIAAEREVLVSGLHQLLAGRAVERFDLWRFGSFGHWLVA